MSTVGSIELGKKYRDGISGYEGTAISGTVYLYGCIRIGLERVDEKGKPEVEFFDEQRMVAVETKPRVHAATSGGPGDAPPARKEPPR